MAKFLRYSGKHKSGYTMLLRYFLLSALSLSLCNPLCAQNKGDQLFDNTFVHEIRFYSPNNHLADTLEAIWLANFDDVPYYPVDVTIDGQAIDSVGVRVKGNLSAFDPKKPYKIDFNRYIAGKEYDGIKKLNLQNADADNTFMRDLLGYYLFRQAGVKASRSAYARVYLNDVYNGVYIMVEQIDATFLKEKFSGNNGTLYKNKDCSTVVDLGPEDLAPLDELDQIVSNLSGAAFQSAIGQVLDTEAFLRFMMIEHFIDARDNPIDVGCNFYVYFEPKADRLYWIPWDLNYAFYGGIDYDLLALGDNTLFKKMMEISAYRQRYLQLSCEFLHYRFRDDLLLPYIDQQAQLVRPSLLNDPYFTNIAQFDNTIAFLKSFVSNTRQRFLTTLNTESVSCDDTWASPVPFMGVAINECMASADSSAGITDPDGGYADWIELYNNTSDPIPLRDFYLSNDRDFLKLWRFPDNAIIGPDAYLIVWADRDINESGLHTNFKLDKAGGAILLSHEDQTVVDSVQYATQTTNVAYARVPNGTGPFTLQNATFGAANTTISSSYDLAIARPGIWLYPNPADRALTVQMTRYPEEPIRAIRLIDPFGRCVAERAGESGIVRFDLRGLPNGIYRVLVQTDHFTGSAAVFKGNQ